MNWNDITAIFGGAFDPPHLGHREAVEGLFRNPGIRDVIVIPTGTPALKTARTPAEHRLEMARRNFRDLVSPSGRTVEVEDREVRREKPSYTFDTLLELRQERGISEGRIAPLAVVIGIDQLAQIDRWHRFPQVLGLAHWIVLERAPDGAEAMGEALRRLQILGVLSSTDDSTLFSTRPGRGPSTVLYCAKTPARAVSSTEIRREFTLKSGEMPLNLASEVESYLKAHRLYGT